MSSSESSRRFHFIREIASGGFGSVYLTKVIHADGFSRLQAVKLLHPRWSENEEIAARMRDEARLLGWLRHKNIVDVMDLTLIDGRCAVLMEYLEASDVKTLIQHCVDTSTRIPLRAALEITAAVAGALDAAYNRPPYAGEKPLRVIHRDIKPSNVMVDDSGVVKVLDFGVARAEFDERESKTQEMAFGSLEYMPPERLFFEPESPASDVYSLGATLYEMLALEKFGKAKLRPKEHEQYFEDRFDFLLDNYPLHQESEDLLHDLLMNMLAFDETNRPTSADCVTRMRAFARRIQDHPLEEWCESVVSQVLKAGREREELKSPGSLVGSVLTEDAKALDQRSIWDENTGMSTQAVEQGGLDDELTGSLADDARWKALKQATIEEMAKKGELGPVRAPRVDPPPAPENVRSLDRTGVPASPRGKASKAPPIATPTPTPSPAALRAMERPGRTAVPVEEDEDDDPTTRSVRVTRKAAQEAVASPHPAASRPAASRPAASGPAASRPAPPEPAGRGSVPARPPAASSAAAARPPEPPAPRSAPRSVPPPPRAPSVTPAPARAPRRPKRRGGLVWTLVLMFMLGAGLGLVAVAVLVFLLALVMIPATQQAAVPRPSVDVTPVPVEVAPATAPAPITGPHVTFTSGRANTETLVARCESGQASGVDRVSIAGDRPGDCTVQAVTPDDRFRFRVEDAEPRAYVCFDGDSRDCR